MDCDNDGGNDPAGDKEGAAGGNGVSFCCCGPSSKIAPNAMPRVSRNDMSRMPRMQPPVANVAQARTSKAAGRWRGNVAHGVR